MAARNEGDVVEAEAVRCVQCVIGQSATQVGEGHRTAAGMGPLRSDGDRPS